MPCVVSELTIYSLIVYTVQSREAMHNNDRGWENLMGGRSTTHKSPEVSPSFFKGSMGPIHTSSHNCDDLLQISRCCCFASLNKLLDLFLAVLAYINCLIYHLQLNIPKPQLQNNHFGFI
jgi:hypothetical protein